MMDNIPLTETLDSANRSVFVPGIGVAHLGYYLDTILSLLNIRNDDPIMKKQPIQSRELEKLRGYTTLTSITIFEMMSLLSLTGEILSPDVCIGKLLIQDDDLCGNSENRVLTVKELGRTSPESIRIDDNFYPVTKVMVFQPIWLQRFWVEPIKSHIKPEAFEKKMAIIQQLVPAMSLVESDMHFRYPSSAQDETQSQGSTTTHGSTTPPDRQPIHDRQPLLDQPTTSHDDSHPLSAPESSCCTVL